MKAKRPFLIPSLTALSSSALALCAAQAQEADPDATVFDQVINPIFQANCVECHGSETVKGKLRLDSQEAIMKGGSEGPAIIAGNSVESPLFYRVSVPHDDFDIMPPEGDGEPLSPSQIAALKWWIDDQQASFEVTLASVELPEDIQALASADVETPSPSDAEPEEEPLPEVPEADPAAVAALQQLGVLVMPLAQDTNLLHVESVSVAGSITDEHIALLEPLAPQLVWLYLNRTGITDSSLEIIGKLPELRRLHLANTQITDAGIRHLEGLSHLETLNIYGTKVTDASLESLEKIPSLKNVYLYGTEVTSRGAFKFLNKNPELDINLGWDFEALKQLDQGLAFHETFNESHQGEIQGGAISYEDGPEAKAATLDGKAFISVSEDVANFDRDEAFSVAAWVKPQEQVKQIIAGRADTEDADRGWAFQINNGTPSFQLVSNGADNGIRVTAKSGLKNDEWYAVAVTYDGSSKAEGVRIYVDGAQLETETQQDNLTRTTRTFESFRVASLDSGPAFKGQMDDLRIYPTALSVEQVGALFDRPEFKEPSKAEAKPDESQPTASTEEKDSPEGTFTFATLAVLFDENSCCAKAHGNEEECGHDCCVQALAAKSVCLKCNPGAEGKELPQS